ncbi:hypothetical protein [Rhizobium lusitanum]|uniref:Uncharacterized protein n=1 Tax=Rhizobium lusitanum TaxID=293958 RepID=A0A7X0MEF1_9HYPH|nr:hypothetical protein [Rhizobium lusitanum]MBB6487629.1 hypothetical protein [Rhizobium lusitanum]
MQNNDKIKGSLISVLWNFAKRQGIASTAILGAGVVIIGNFYNLPGMTVVGSLLSMFAALAAAIQQNEFQEKVEEQNLHISSSITGGLSFCHGYPFRENEALDTYEWTFIHVGKYPIHNVSVRIVHIDDLIENGNLISKNLLGNNFNLGTILPGKSHDFGINSRNPNFIACNLFFSARNGDWVQEFRRIRTSDGFAYVNKVDRWTDNPNDLVALYEESPNFPRLETGEIDWKGLPPIARKEET